MDKSTSSFSQFVWLWNRSQRQCTPALHLELAEWLEVAWHSGNLKLLLMVFRNAGKSSLVALFVTWLLSRNSNLRILVVSADQSLAVKMTRNIREIIEQNPKTAHMLNKTTGEWAADRITVPRTKAFRDPSVLARGLNGNLTGARADVIICDDIEVPNNCDTRLKRSELRRRLRELEFVLVPGGSQLFVGTPHNYHSIYCDNVEQENGESEPPLRNYLRKIVPIVTPTGESRWPERFSTQQINELAENAGPNQYKSQMLLEPTHAHNIRLDPEQLHIYSGSIAIVYRNGLRQLCIDGVEMKGACCWWDPSYGRPNVGDSCVVACIFTDDKGRYWLHDIEYLNFEQNKTGEEDEASQLCRQVLNFAQRNEQPSITVENNGIGRFLPGLLRRAAGQNSQPISVLEKSSTQNKVRRILEAFDPILASGHLYVHENVLKSPFTREMREWRADGKCQDDGLDAVAGCLHSEPVRLDLPAPRAPAQRWGKGGATFKAKTAFAV